MGSSFEAVGWTWPFGSERVSHVALQLGDDRVADARLTLRPDIAAALGQPEAVLSGFEATIELPDDATELDLSIEVHGLDGGNWSGPAWRLPVAAAPRPEAGTEGEDGQVAPSATRVASPSPRRDEMARRRLGYDPWHVVVLVTDAASCAGPAIAALDAVAERLPHLELLVAGVRADGYLAHLLTSAIPDLGLADRVTVLAEHVLSNDWLGVVDVVLEPTVPGADGRDLAALVDLFDIAVRDAGSAG